MRITKINYTSFLSEKILKNMGFKYIGKNVKISTYARFYGTKDISINNNVRIDDFCFLSSQSGFINIGNFVHIGVGTKLFGIGGIEMKDFSGCASDVKIYSGSDDYSGEYMTNPTVGEYDKNLIKLYKKKITIGKHTIIGTNSIILPGASICDNCSIGCMSVVNKEITTEGIYIGNPVKFLKKTKNGRLELEKNIIL